MNTAFQNNSFLLPAAFCGRDAMRLCESCAEGEIIGVFSAAIYARLCGECVVFHSSDYGTVPFGMAFGDVHAFINAVSCEVGMSISVSRSVIKIGDISYEFTALPADTQKQKKLEKPNSSRIALLIRDILKAGSHKGIIECIAENRAGCRQSITEMCRGLSLGNGETSLHGARRLMGLGRGLTPSGDDFLCGFFTVLISAVQSGIADMPTLGFCINGILSSLDRTSEISGAYVSAALRGKYFTVYEKAVSACLSAEDFTDDICHVLKMGASSGTDTMCGAVTATALLCGASIENVLLAIVDK